MLVNAKAVAPHPQITMVLGVMSSYGPLVPTPQEPGVYMCGHWSPERFLAVRDTWDIGRDYDTYGVCDTPEQCIERLKLREIDKKVCVVFVRLLREDQPPEGGWRWHKWGPYIGDQKPEHEYLYDEKHIERVYTFHVYDVIEEA